MTNTFKPQEFREVKDRLELTKLAALQATPETSYSGRLADAFDNCGMEGEFDWNRSPSFTLYRQIWQAVRRCKEIDGMGLSGLADYMFTAERQEYRDLQVWLHRAEILLSEINMRAIYPSLPESLGGRSQ